MSKPDAGGGRPPSKAVLDRQIKRQEARIDAIGPEDPRAQSSGGIFQRSQKEIMQRDLRVWKLARESRFGAPEVTGGGAAGEVTGGGAAGEVTGGSGKQTKPKPDRVGGSTSASAAEAIPVVRRRKEDEDQHSAARKKLGVG